MLKTADMESETTNDLNTPEKKLIHSLNESKGRISNRPRKTIERLSETLSKKYVEAEENREKQNSALVAQLEVNGTQLGDIPLIEASLKKSKPADLKLLHMAAFCRPGSVNEIRGNLRHFRGFSFTNTSNEYIKRQVSLNKKSTTDLRGALRVLNLEVSGSRSQLTTRLLDFLLSPSSDCVKYKGKLHKKPTQRRISKTIKSVNPKKTQSPKSAKKVVSNVDGSVSELSDLNDEDKNETLSSSDSLYSPKQSVKSTVPTKSKKEVRRRLSVQSNGIKIGLPSPTISPSKTPKVNSISPKNGLKKRRRILNDDEENDEDVLARKKKSEEVEKVEEDSNSEDEMPLVQMIPEKPKFPTDDELKEKVCSWLKTANLQETSMKVVRNAISESYTGIDISSKKQFLNDTIKEYLASFL